MTGRMKSLEEKYAGAIWTAAGHTEPAAYGKSFLRRAIPADFTVLSG